MFGVAHKLPVAINTDMRLFNLHYFISHFVFHCLLMVAYNRTEQIFFFFRS